jgi:hypothetical protein
VHNVAKAPSNDCLIVHPPLNIEEIQFKSCGNITRGLEPNPDSQGILVLGIKRGKTKKTIWSEFNKVMDAKHKKFYSHLGKNYRFTLFVVSNKPLKNFNAIKKAVADRNYKKGLPKGVVLVCHENFEAYAGSLAHRGLFRPLKRKHEGDTEEKSKQQKMEM